MSRRHTSRFDRLPYDEPPPVYDDNGEFDLEAWMDELEDRVKNPRRVVVDDDEPAPPYGTAEVLA